MFLVVWSYKVSIVNQYAFETMYGKNGKWVRLFNRFPDYIKTELCKDLNNENHYISMDYWNSRESYYAFRKMTEKEFTEIDKFGEKITLEETRLGEFELV